MPYEIPFSQLPGLGRGSLVLRSSARSLESESSVRRGGLPRISSTAMSK